MPKKKKKTKKKQKKIKRKSKKRLKSRRKLNKNSNKGWYYQTQDFKHINKKKIEELLKKKVTGIQE